MNPLQEKRKALGQQRACFGGDSSSSSSQTTNNVYTDNRQVNNTSVDNHSTNLFSNWGQVSEGGTFAPTVTVDRSFNTNSFNTTNNSTSVVTTDHGAVQGALASNNANVGLIMALAEKLTAGTNDILKKNTTLAQELTGSTQQAYSNAAASASGMNTFLFVAVGVVALAWIVTRKN